MGASSPQLNISEPLNMQLLMNSEPFSPLESQKYQTNNIFSHVPNFIVDKTESMINQTDFFIWATLINDPPKYKELSII